MAAPVTPFESPRACPFVALELDRDRRSDKPDYRHRCFAEPTPAPRSLAHQEAYCLSPGFAACPVFQDWAVRAAARPTESVAPSASIETPAIDSAAVGVAAVGAGGMAAVDADGTAAANVDEGEEAATVEPPEMAPAASPPSAWNAMAAPADPHQVESAIEELPEDASVTPAGAEIAAAAAALTGIGPALASPPTFATTDWQSEAHESEQLGVFDAPPDDLQSTFEPHSSYGQPDAGHSEAQQPPAAFVPPPVRPSQQTVTAADAAAVAAPAFLAGRSSRPPTATISAAGGVTPPSEKVSREEIVPSWELDGRYGAEAPPSKGGGSGSRLDGVLTAIAVVAILALGVAAVLFLPGLLNKGSVAKTPLPSFVLSSNLPSAQPSAVTSAAPTVGASVGPTLEPTTPASSGPVGSPRLYTIKAGDSLAHIANKFGVTVQQILDANPDINDPNNIFVGQIIVIPPSTPAST